MCGVFRIGEFSKLTQISIRMLRYYDEAGLLKPAQIDKFTGYRSYSVDQIPILHRILFLRDSGFQISEIAGILKNWNDDFILKELQSKRDEIRALIEEEKRRAAKIDSAIHDLKKEQISLHCNVTIRKIPGYPVLSLRKIIPNYFAEGELWKELAERMEQEQIRLPQNTLNFAIYHDTDYKEADVDVEVCAVIPEAVYYESSELFRVTEEVEAMACFMVYGPFENIGPAFESFAHWLTENDQYRMAGLNRQICHRGPWNEENPDKYLTEIQIPVEMIRLNKTQ
jgi:DNA-binding transcriptional MerR regulator